MTAESPIAAPRTHTSTRAGLAPTGLGPAKTGGRRAVAHLGHVAAQLWRFGMIQLQCCGFAIAVIGGLAASTLLRGYWDAPILRYDALLLYLILVQALFLLTRLETPGELLVICVFHLAGLGLEWFKVAVGSWHYPEPGVATLGGVPLYAGFMYAAVGSYICQAFRRFDLQISDYRLGLVGMLAVLAYLNFFSHQVIVDLRDAIMAGFLLACARMRTGVHHRRTPVLNATAAVARSDRPVLVDRGETRDVIRRLGAPRAGGRLAAGPPGQVRFVDAAGEPELCAGHRPVSTPAPRTRRGLAKPEADRAAVGAVGAAWHHRRCEPKRPRSASGARG
ncbi:DUF817 family protein [Mycolicibacterium brumae]|uniref:DUF817 family protein n=1 Tax=Mycolicibacterium brumae TaxID=85968 RepID=UPI000FE2101A|nr:DUF817 family protein [Mycolicibacterium brumae]UWW09354.1 DUF817 domain-containing protein [Mycolicibacterium brumae]